MCAAGLASLALAPSASAASTTYRADADAFTNSASPSTNYGTQTDLKLDGSPTVTSFVRFNPQPGAAITKATLRFYANTETSSGFDVRSAGNGTWSERTITNANAPAVGSTVIARSGAFARRQWVSVDVTSAVTQGGPVTFALKSGSTSDYLLAARESGTTRAAQLVVETGAVAPAPTPTPSPSTTPTPTPSPTATPNPTPPPSSTPTPPASGSDQVRPYDAASPWNTPISPGTGIDPKSSSYMTAISDNGLPLTSDPDQYAIPVYRYDSSTPRRTVKMSGYFSSYDAGDSSRKGYGYAATISDVPIPANAVQSEGTDGQIVIWDPAAQTEYSFWQFAKDASGNYTATNGYRYHTGPGYNGRFADGLAGRGAGTPYFAGLVRKWEIDQGRIDHALAFAYHAPSGEFRYPASKSDGAGFGGVTGTDVPEGSRLQLDPTLTDADFNAWGLSPAAKTIAKAMQTYGMYVIDNSGSSKIYLEDRMTAGWDSSIDRNLTKNIPWSKFRVVNAPNQP